MNLMNQTLYRATSTEGQTKIRKCNIKHEFQNRVRTQAKDPGKDLITCRKPLCYNFSGNVLHHYKLEESQIQHEIRFPSEGQTH